MEARGRVFSVVYDIQIPAVPFVGSYRIFSMTRYDGCIDSQPHSTRFGVSRTQQTI